MVIPRSRSMSILSSTWALPVISRSVRPPVAWISRSASVDLPWSICAMMEKLRILLISVIPPRAIVAGDRGAIDEAYRARGTWICAGGRGAGEGGEPAAADRELLDGRDDDQRDGRRHDGRRRAAEHDPDHGHDERPIVGRPHARPPARVAGQGGGAAG